MKYLQQCKQYRLFVLCTFLMIMTLMTLPRSVSAGGRRSKLSRHSLDRRNGRERLPIQPDDPSGSSRGRGRGSRKKASECRFSDKRYELEDTWHPDLGPPFGVMYCVHCECVAFPKKKRIVGRVRCKNIKTECPKPTCMDPVLLPGRCCKVCPGQNDNPDLAINVDLGREEEEKNGRHYAALLSQHSSLSPTTSTSIATGRFYFRKKALSYSFVTSPEYGFPTTLTFLDGQGNIIEEFPLRPTHFQNETEKICGSWQRVPRRYRRQLRQDELYAQLTNKQGEVISGKVSKHYGLSFELFSALIGNQQNPGHSAAATAIVSVQAATGSIHANLLMSGLLPPQSNDISIGQQDIDTPLAPITTNNLVSNDAPTYPLEVKFESKDEITGETRTITEDLTLSSIDNVLSSIDFRTVFDGPELKALGEGRLSISIRLKNQPISSTIKGLLAPKFTCDLFDCALIPFDMNENSNNNQVVDPNNANGATSVVGGDVDTNNAISDTNENFVELVESPISRSHNMRGLAWMTMHKTGSLKYQMRIEGLTGTVDSIKIDNGKKSRRLLRVIDDLGSNFALSNEIGGLGWSNGSIKMEALDIEALYRSNLYLNILTSGNGGNGPDAMRCRITPHLLSPANELSTSPILMKSDPPSSDTSSVSGIAWTNMDSTCRIHYSARLAGLEDSNGMSKLVLKDYPLRHQNLKPLGRGSVREFELQNFRGATVSGHHDSLHKLTMTRMNEGDASLVISHQDAEFPDKSFSIEGRVSGFEVPGECLPRIQRELLEEVPGMLSDMNEVRQEVVNEYEKKCVYEGTVYNNGEQWKATHDSCKMCSCKSGTTECNQILCPTPSCANPIIPEGECCSTCSDIQPNGSSYCEYEGDGRKHLAGTTWHPYIPPWGFMRCAICTCPADTLQVECKSKECPELDCPTELQVRPSEQACCKICKDPPPPKPEEVVEHNKLNDRPQIRTEEDVLNAGGCRVRGAVYENGAVWHPSVLPYGEINCVTCKCKDGNDHCSRKACPSLSCRYQIQDENACCSRCAVNRAEKKQAQKQIRLKKLRKLRRLRRIRDRKLRKKEELQNSGQQEQQLSN